LQGAIVYSGLYFPVEFYRKLSNRETVSAYIVLIVLIMIFNSRNNHERSSIMKKVLNMGLALLMVFGFSSAYACGEKKSSADATTGGAELTASSKLSCGSRAEVTAAVAKADRAEIDNLNASKNCMPKTQKASVRNADVKGQHRPASSTCPTPCVKKAGEAEIRKSSVSTDSKVDLTRMASTSKEAEPETNSIE
jgi:hypothetical protein